EIAGAIGAVGARFLDTEEVTGSNPVSPTVFSAGQRLVTVIAVTSCFICVPYVGSKLGAHDRYRRVVVIVPAPAGGQIWLGVTSRGRRRTAPPPAGLRVVVMPPGGAVGGLCWCWAGWSASGVGGRR